ncbi:MAG: hypothetical protein AAGJ18_04095 [Bacteroidota bacterium]
MRFPTLLFVLATALPISLLSAQTNPSPKLTIQPTLAIQLWATYTDDQQLYNNDLQDFEAVDNRLNFTLHRSRMGIKGTYGDRLFYDFTGAVDFVGQDALAGYVGAPNNTASPRFRIWNFLTQYKISRKSESLYWTFGYFSPLISRESITSPFAVGSFEKAWSQNYIRRHIVGTGPGRIVGSNFGGFFQNDNQKLSLDYNLGLWNPRMIAINGNSAGQRFSPLLTYRLAVHIGDAEFNKYSRGLKFNFKGQRKGITLGISGSRQGASDQWDENISFGLDLLANFGTINLSSEWMQLKRDFNGLSTTSHTGFVKIGSYFKLANGKELEPVIKYVFFEGPTDLRGQENAFSLGAFSGVDNYLEITLNYFLAAKVKLSLAYTFRAGESGEIGPVPVNNNFYKQGGVGTIQKGDYLGFGLLFTI